MTKIYIPGSDNFFLDDTDVNVYKETSPHTFEVIMPHYDREYPYWFISYNSTWRKCFCHRVVAELCIENPFDYPVVNHKDGNKTNWHIENLEWVTQRTNVLHAQRNGLVPKTTPPETVAKIKTLLHLGVTIKDVSAVTQVSYQTVWNIAHGVRHAE